MAKERSRRDNAGSKMARLLNAEDEDEFYTNTYGGFTEEQDDMDYKSESSVDDIFDSDIDLSENDEVKSDDDDDQTKKKKRVVTKAYKEPKRQKSAKSSDVIEEVPAKLKPKVKVDKLPPEPVVIEKKTLRHSTTAKTVAIGRREKEIKARQAHLKEMAQRKNVSEVRRLTQEELLEEAKITEQINTRSLLQYQRLELEKKKAKIQKQVNRGPMIRYQSITVPLIDEESNVFGITVDCVTGESSERPLLLNDTKCSRTFVTFTDDATFKKTFSKCRPPRPRDKLCPITGKSARYLDPLTKTPYYDLAAFRVLRHLYQLHVDAGEKPIDLLRKFRDGCLSVPDVQVTPPGLA